MILDPVMYQNADDFSRACLSRLIDHMQERKRISAEDSTRLKRIYIKKPISQFTAKKRNCSSTNNSGQN